MTTLGIKDLPSNEELGRKAMADVRGGYIYGFLYMRMLKEQQHVPQEPGVVPPSIGILPQQS